MTAYSFLDTVVINDQTAYTDIAINTAVQVPLGQTASRPTTPVAGMIRFNTNSRDLEGYDGIEWLSIDHRPFI
jgi:hypothetical protein